MPRFCCLPLLLAVAFLVFLSAGCEPAAHLSWSPDGTHAAYFAPVQGKLLPGANYIIDPTGKVTDQLGAAFGSFAWSTDSKSLYFAGYDEKGPATNVAIRKWLIDAEDAPAAAVPADAKDELPPMVLNRWQNGTVEHLAQLGNRSVLFVYTSPDQNWIAVVTLAKTGDNDHGHYELFAYNTASKKLFAVSDNCGLAACFTAPGKLAYVETIREDLSTSSTGHIVEVQLDETAEQLQRTPLVTVLWKTTIDMYAVDDGLLFTTASRTFPAKAGTANDDDRAMTLFHFTRANGGMNAAADSAMPLFLPSPDRQRILFIKITPAAGDVPEKRELAVMNSNGSDAHPLRDITSYGPQTPMWPTWHGNDMITFISATPIANIPAQPNEAARMAFDVVNYKITPQWSLEPVKTLSQGWPVEMKPAMKVPMNAVDVKPAK